MERNFNNKDFEQFLKRNADQYRMYPSEKVWKGVYSSLHTRKRWYGLGFVLLILTAVVVTWVMVSGPSAKQQATNPIANNEIKQPIAASQKKQSTVALGSTVTPNNILPEPFITQPESVLKQPVEAYQPVENQQEPAKNISVSLAENSTPVVSHIQPVLADNNETNFANREFVFNANDQSTDNNYDLNETQKANEIAEVAQKFAHNESAYPMTIESVFNSYKKAPVKKHLGVQFFVTPTVSYRRLTENKSFLRNTTSSGNSLTYAYLYNVNSVVTHKPDMGFQLGVMTDYPLTNVIKLLGGLQFNINRYGIKAYTSTTEVATIQLNGGGGYRPDSVATATNYRNFNGNNSNWLQNFYFSVSAPIGAEVRLAKKNKSELGFAATIQPTYVLGDKAYLISTDYKNYVQVPWLVRRWNVNTSLQAYVNFNAGKLKMQVGPQVRYQLLSSFQNKYPVKENLFDFGLKLGIKLNK